MKLTQTTLSAIGLIFLLMHGSLDAFESKLKLSGKKGLVIGIENREAVLELGETYLSAPEENFLPLIESLEDPFVFKSSTPSVVPEQNEEETPERQIPEAKSTHYEDAEVLALSAASFAKKVRGTITRGDVTFLQLEGGALLQPGTSFPVRLPQAKDQNFMLSITEIDSDGYTLQIGGATKQFKFNNKAQSDSGIQFTNP